MTAHWQEWAVALLLLLCIVRIGLNVRNFFRKANGKKSPCSSCPTGCDLKRQCEQKEKSLSDSGQPHQK